MSEVKRYDMDHFCGGLVAHPDGAWYHEADFDRVTAERDAALGREVALRFEYEEMVRRATAALSNLTFTKNELNDTREAYLHQSARLTAADERNDVAIDLLRRARAVIAGGGWADLERDIAYFFKPAEGGVYDEMTDADWQLKDDMDRYDEEKDQP